MSTLRLDRLLEFFTSIQLVMAMLWLGWRIFTVGLAVLLYTRWGQYKPLRKCMAMSLLAHLLLAGYAATMRDRHARHPAPSGAGGPGHARRQAGRKAGAGGAGPAGGRRRATGHGRFFPATPCAARKKRSWNAERPISRRSRAAWFASRMRSCPVIRRWITSPWPRPNRCRRKPRPWSKRPGEPPPGESAAAIEAPPAQRRDAAAPPLPGAAAPPRTPGRRRLDAAGPPLDQRSAGRRCSIRSAAAKNDRGRRPQPLVTAADSGNPMRLKPVERMMHKVGGDAAYGGAGGSAAADRRPAAAARRHGIRPSAAPSIAGLTRKGPGGGEAERRLGPVASVTPD